MPAILNPMQNSPKKQTKLLKHLLKMLYWSRLYGSRVNFDFIIPNSGISDINGSCCVSLM